MLSIDVTESTAWNEILAMSTIALLPSVLVFFLAPENTSSKAQPPGSVKDELAVSRRWFLGALAATSWRGARSGGAGGTAHVVVGGNDVHGALLATLRKFEARYPPHPRQRANTPGGSAS